MNVSEINTIVEDEEKFYIFIESKMLSCGISDEIIARLELVKSKLFLDYDRLEIMDMHVLNTKIEHIFQAELLGEYSVDQVFKIAFQTLKTKE